MLEEAIAHYHGLLDPDTARATQEALTAGQRERNLFFGERPICTVLRPRLMTREHYDLLGRGCGLVVAAARRLALAALEDEELRSVLELTPGEEAIVRMDPGYEEPSAHSRMDTFLTTDGRSLRFVEYNAESPAAIAYEDVLSEVFLGLPAMTRFAETYEVSPLPARHRLLGTLLDAWREFGGSGEPTIAIVDWTGLPTHSEFLLFQAYFRERGLTAIICSPDDLRFDGRELTAETDGGRVRVDLVYKRVLTSELLERYGDEALEHPLVLAYAAGKACLVNSFRAKLLHKKSLFALLSDDALQDRLTVEEQIAVSEHVPWTRLVRDGPTTYEGETVDLLRFAQKNRGNLVLKPNDEYGGKGVLIGWETSPEDWARGLRDALKSPAVLQERVEIAYEDYPAFVDGRLEVSRRLVDSDPFMFGGEVGGCLTRLSTVTLLNVTAGGGSSAPVFVVNERTVQGGAP